MLGSIKKNKFWLEKMVRAHSPQVGVIILLAFFTGQCFLSMAQKSPTCDEPVHISAGYSYVSKWDPRMNPEHPPLIKIISALPLIFLKLDGLFHSQEFKDGSNSQVMYGVNFVFRNSQPFTKIVFLARVPIVLLGILLGIYVFLWTRELFGVKAGLLALTFYSFSPNILANARIVTTDLGVAVFIFISTYYFWKLYKHKLWKYAFICGFFLGLAQISKFTAAYMAPFFLLITIIQIVIDLKKESGLWKKRIYWLVLIFFIAWVIIWLFYLPFGKPYLVQEKSLFFMMPYQYARGANMLLAHTQRGHDSFFFGERSEEGWKYYYILLYLIKAPLAFIILLGIYLFFKLFKRNQTKRVHLIIYLVPILIILWSSFLNKANIGIRHILPVFPFLFLLVGSLTTIQLKKQQNKRILCLIVTILLIWYIGNAFWIYPDFLMHFNQLVGGPENGWKYSVLGDDWGQDDLKLVKWMKENDYQSFNFIARYQPTIESIRKYSTEKGIKANVHKFDRKRNRVRKFEEKLPVAFHIGLAQKEPKYFNKFLEHDPFAKIGYAIFIYDFKKQNIDIKGVFKEEEK